MAKTLLFTVFCAFHVFLKLQKQCKYQHLLRSTRQKCCNSQCFFALLSKTLVFAVCLCISGLKKYWYLQHFLRFCIVPAKDVKTHKYSNLQHFVDFEKLKMSEKCVKTALFSDFRYPQNGRGGLCSWRRL